MAKISVKPIQQVIAKTTVDNLFEKACLIAHLYPGYTPDEVMNMSAKRAETMLRVAKRQLATNYMNMLQITLVGLAEKPKNAAQNLEHYYEGIING